VSGWSMEFGPGLQEGVAAPAKNEDVRLQLSDVRKLVHRTQRRIVGAAREGDRVTFARLISDHLGMERSSVDVVEETWPSYDHVNVQVGLDAWLERPGREHTLIGVANFRHREFDLSDLMRSSEPGHYGGLTPGNVARLNLPVGPSGQVRACVVCAVYLVEEGDRRAVLLLRIGRSDMGEQATRLEIAADAPDFAARIAAEVRASALEHNIYRGQVVSFGRDMFGERHTVLSFHHRPTMSLDDLILPAATVDAITRQVVGVARHRAQLLAAGQHLKRGLLLYGPPGVGKTHTIRYLTSQLTETTIVLLAGDTLHLIGAACSVARTLQPAMIVVEDVDLIAEDRDMYEGASPVLFQLLNEMDGLAEDADVVFLLTTNRADLLEPALAERPGRVDQAVSVEMPDREARRRLFALYRAGLDVDESRLDSVLNRTDGVTASFLKELLRRAAVRAAEARTEADEPAGALAVTADDLDAALDELLDTRNAMTRVLLGGPRKVKQ
jgi:ATPase family protein associated with various cellular activities (AAA)